MEESGIPSKNVFGKRAYTSAAHATSSNLLSAGISQACAHVVLLVFAYSGQDMDDLHDASVFVADPERAGTGPGGMHIMSAARLSGKGSVNFAARLERSSTDGAGGARCASSQPLCHPHQAVQAHPRLPGSDLGTWPERGCHLVSTCVSSEYHVWCFARAIAP